MDRASRWLGAITAAGGVMILTGWWLDLGLLATALPGWPPTRPSTALAFVLAGTALWRLRDATRGEAGTAMNRAGVTCALLTAAVGVLALAGYALPADVGLNGLLVADPARLGGMPLDPHTPLSAAVGVALLGAALALLHVGGKAISVGQALFVMTASAAVLPLMDDLITGGLGRFRQSFGSLGILTTVFILLISAAGLSAFPPAGVGHRARRINRALPLALGAFGLAVWVIARGIQQGSYDASAGLSGIALAGFLLIGLILWASARLVAQTEDELERLFTLAPDVLCIADFTGYFRRVNPAASRLLGWSIEELQARPFLDFVHTDDRESTLAEMEKLSGGALTLNFENRYRCKDGTWRWLSWTSYPRPAEDRIYAVARDVTEARRARDEIARLNAELEAFSYSVSHDLRAPLRHANGFVQLLQKHLGAAALDATTQRYLDTIARATQRMGDLIDDLLAFSRASRVDLRRQRVALNSVVDAARSDLKGQAAGRDIQWTIAALPEVEGDPSLLRQVFINLLSNAIKYTHGRPQALIEVGALPQNGDGAVVFVRDNGAGFDMQYSDKLFGVFQRLHSREEFEGTGIGLALVRRIVQRHGGATWAEGKEGEGATFYVSLPSRRAEE